MAIAFFTETACMGPVKTPCISPLSLLIAAAAASPAQADELACKPGVEETTFARATYALPPKNIHQLRGELEVWATEAELNQGGTGSYDPKTRIHTWTVLMGPQDKGVSLSGRFTTATNQLELEAGNVCWEEQSDWRPWWQLLNKTLLSWGYTKVQ